MLKAAMVTAVVALVRVGVTKQLPYGLRQHFGPVFWTSSCIAAGISPQVPCSSKQASTVPHKQFA